MNTIKLSYHLTPNFKGHKKTTSGRFKMFFDDQPKIATLFGSERRIMAAQSIFLSHQKYKICFGMPRAYNKGTIS